MKTSLKFLALSLIAATVVLAGCVSSSGDRTVGQKIDDRMVNSKVRDALSDSEVYKFPNVQVATYDKVVQLSGWVDTEEQKTRAAELARQVKGVQDVVNNIMLKPQGEAETAREQSRKESEAKGGTVP